MRFAICNETFGEMPLEQAVELAASLGYTGWEVAPFMLGKCATEISAAQRQRYRQVVRAAGLEIIGLHWLLAKTEGFHLTTADADTRRRTAAYFAELIDLCGDLCQDNTAGETAGVMVLGSPLQRNRSEGVSTEQAMQHTAEVLGDLGDALQRRDVRIALEPLSPQEGNFLNTAAEARLLKQLLPEPRIGLHLDVKAMSSEPEPIVDIIRENADWLLHFHANDPNLRGPGMGDMDFAPIMAALRQIGYTGWVSVEVFDYAPGAERLARESIETLKRVCG